MKPKFNFSNKIVARVVLKVVKIVDIVDNCLEELTLLEVILDLEGLYPLGFK